MDENEALADVALQVQKLAASNARLRAAVGATLAVAVAALGLAGWSTLNQFAPRSDGDFQGSITIRDQKGREGIFLGFDALGTPGIRLKEGISTHGQGIQMGFRAHSGDPFIQLVDAGGIRLQINADTSGSGRSSPHIGLIGDGGVEEVSLAVIPQGWPLISVGRVDAPHLLFNLWSPTAMKAALVPEGDLVTPLHEKVREATRKPPYFSPHIYLLGFHSDVLWQSPDIDLTQQLETSRQHREKIRALTQ